MKPKEIAVRYPLLKLLPVDTVVKRSGKGWTLRCPFHEDKTPSFYVSQDRDGIWLWYCHAGCGGGDVIDFWRRLRGLTFPEALRDLAGPEAAAKVAVMIQRNREQDETRDARDGREFVFMCDTCGKLTEVARPGQVPELVAWLQQLGWVISPPQGPDCGDRSWCPDCIEGRRRAA